MYFAREKKGHEGVKGAPTEDYQEILQAAAAEYEYIPPNEYYKKGDSLYHQLETYMSGHLLFLHDCRAPATNNEADKSI